MGYAQLDVSWISRVFICEWPFTQMFICCCCNSMMFYDWHECVMSVPGLQKNTPKAIALTLGNKVVWYCRRLCVTGLAMDLWRRKALAKWSVYFAQKDSGPCSESPEVPLVVWPCSERPEVPLVVWLCSERPEVPLVVWPCSERPEVPLVVWPCSERPEVPLVVCSAAVDAQGEWTCCRVWYLRAGWGSCCACWRDAWRWTPRRAACSSSTCAMRLRSCTPVGRSPFMTCWGESWRAEVWVWCAEVSLTCWGEWCTEVSDALK